MSGKVTLYISSVVSNMEVRKQQQRIKDVLSGKKIEFDEVDVSADRENLTRMREVVGDDKALAPQIANGDSYCGNYEAFDMAVEDGALNEFLKV
ncbi:SH3 domain-binding glutamic acid-rich-like protein 3 [Aplysia californica]|uniref:SH3 domain-binding glutamic acid-rich-like protein n=1 Tax=Aplysia californica TaxID=6500 RepID=A0ABM1AC81_APLCA|nr:SH3 domain-binding glutamic acid-rich-like protein 3 [Aplysia californica]